MWFSFWRSRQRFSLDELRYLTDQLQKIQIVTDINKDFVIEALRSIAELVTYGDQHDPTFFEFFMEKQVMGEFVRILNISRTVTVPLQLLQTMSIMIQNLKSEHAIYYIFSNEHINALISYSFDFRNEELLSYYISFLRAISGKLDKNTISLLVKTQNEEVVSFPLYTEAIKFAFHEENMVRTAIRALTLNVYHVGDECVSRFVTSPPLADYFFDLVTYFRKQCINLDGLVSEVTKSHRTPHLTSSIPAAVDEIEDNLYYFSDVISSGVPNLEILITENILLHLVFPLFFSSIKVDSGNGTKIGAATSLYLLCCVLLIVKTKDLASSIAASLFCPSDAFIPRLEPKPNGHVFRHNMSHKNEKLESGPSDGEVEQESSRDAGETPPGPSKIGSAEELLLYRNYSGSSKTLREVLLSYIVNGDDIQVSGSLSVLATLLQTKELDESMLDALGILPQRKQHKKLLLQALMGEGSGEEQLFSSENNLMKDGICNELDTYLQRLKDQYGLQCSSSEPGTSPRIHRYQVLDVLVDLFCRPNVSAETLWLGGWLLRQLLPYSEQEFNSHHLKLLQDSYKNCSRALLLEIKGSWCDLLITVLIDEWKKCKKAIEASSSQKDLRCILLPPGAHSSESESSLAAGERMREVVKVFVLHHQLQVFSVGGTLPDQPLIQSPIDSSFNSRAKRAGLDVIVPKPGIEISLVDAIHCRIAFERGKERHFWFLAISGGTSGWVLLAEELPLKLNCGVVRVAAPLAGSNPRIDDKHSKWLHLRIRPSILPFMDPINSETTRKSKTKVLVDGRWTLAFRDEQSCKSADSMILEEMNLQSSEVDKRLRTAFRLDSSVLEESSLTLSNSSLLPSIGAVK